MFPRFPFVTVSMLVIGLSLWAQPSLAQGVKEAQEAGKSGTVSLSQSSPSAGLEIATPKPETDRERVDLTDPEAERVHDFRSLLQAQDPGLKLVNPLKHAIRNAVETGVPINTIVLLLLLPLIASIIASARHLIGIRGFGIFLPAALSVAFFAIGPVPGIGLFLVIVVVSTVARLVMRKLKFRLQYLPRMAIILWLVSLSVLGTLFAAPYLGRMDIVNVSIFPVLFLVLLAEDFTRVQLGKSVRVAVNLTSETLILAIVAFAVLSHQFVQNMALLNPEILLLSVALWDFFIGKYVGLRILEIWRFRKLITK